MKYPETISACNVFCFFFLKYMNDITWLLERKYTHHGWESAYYFLFPAVNGEGVQILYLIPSFFYLLLVDAWYLEGGCSLQSKTKSFTSQIKETAFYILEEPGRPHGASSHEWGNGSVCAWRRFVCLPGYTQSRLRWFVIHRLICSVPTDKTLAHAESIYATHENHECISIRCRALPMQRKMNKRVRDFSSQWN